MNKLPVEIINKIIPYTYRFQDRSLLLDIKSFNNDISIIYNTYFTTLHGFERHRIHNQYILLVDLEDYFLNKISSQKLHDVMKRFYILSNVKNYSENKFLNYFFKYKDKNQLSKIRLLLGIMNPFERTDFINIYILDD